MPPRPATRTLTLAALAATLLAVTAAGLLVPKLTWRAPAPTATQPVAVLDTKSSEKRRLPPSTPTHSTGALDAAARIPASADLVLVVEGADALRLSPFGQAAAKFFLDAPGLAQSRAAWTALAQQLGWSESEMFDNLLGSRVVLVARSAPSAGEPGAQSERTVLWALLSDVSLDTDRRLKDRLQASHRSIDHGHQVLSIEKGRYELTSHRRTESAAGDPTVTIVLGPAGRSEIFDEMVGVLADGATDTLARREVLVEASRGGPPEILFLARRDPSECLEDGAAAATAPPPDRWADFFVLAGLSDPGTQSELNARVIYRDRARRAANLDIPLSSEAVFTALAPDSLLTIVQAAPLQELLGRGVFMLDALREVPLPEPARAALATRQVLSLVRVPATTPSSPPRCAAVLAMEATSTGDLARTLDGAVARFAESVEQSPGTTQPPLPPPPPPHDFRGELPQIPRVLHLRVGEGNPVRLLTAEPLTLAWSYPAAPAINTGAAPGWWVVAVAPTIGSGGDGGTGSASDLQRRAATVLTAPPAAQDLRRWVWQAAGRPAELEALLPAIVPDIAGFRTAMKRFDHLRADLSVSDAGDIQGDITIRLAPGP